MSDGIGRERLLSALRLGDETTWAIVHELAETAEEKRRRILRPHAEAGFMPGRDDPEMAARQRLDNALGPLTLFEIGRQIGGLTENDRSPVQPADFKKLVDSNAFLRYSNAYLYFGIRLLAGRLAPPDFMGGARASRAPEDQNRREFALAVPPPIPSTTDTQEALARFLHLKDSDQPDKDPLRFLDGFATGKEPDLFERWLRGLGPETNEVTAARFAGIAQGLTDWALARTEFYLSLQPSAPRPAITYGDAGLGEAGPNRPAGGWKVTNPIAGRLGLADVYWIARLLRADVASDGSVTYGQRSWLDLLGLRARLHGAAALEQSLRKAEEVLRNVFDFTCDLIQNAAEITDEKERKWFQPKLYPELPETTAQWRETFDEELEEIELQRLRREFLESEIPARRAARRPRNPDGWSQRVKTGEQPGNLIGLAFSGGGIRSATFNLGVTQGLQQFDLLRYVDYLSTVSGGGFIGSWLIANVKLTTHWLGRLTNWQESVAHLRRYSNYLAPSSGMLSADTWTMWGIWLRNAFLIQLTGATWLAALLLAALAGQSLFRLAGAGPPVLFGVVPVSGVLAMAMALPIVWTILWNLTEPGGSGTRRAFSAEWVKGLAVLPAWIGSFLIAGLLWGDATGRSAAAQWFAPLHGYSEILSHAWRPWGPLLIFVWIALLSIAAVTSARQRWHALWIGTATTATLYMLLCATMFLFRRWSVDRERFDWYAFIFGPTLVLAGLALSIVLFIGFCGRNSGESIREWWTRFGSWLGIYGVFYLALTMSAVLGPLWILSLLALHPNIGAGTAAGWVGTVLGGLLAGNSRKTNGTSTRGKAPWLELLGRAAGLLFIIGGVLMVATTVYALMVNIAEQPLSALSYWLALNNVPLRLFLTALAAALISGSLFSWFFEINIFGLNQFYRNRLVRCYLGATRWAPGLRKPQPFTGFDGHDDIKLSKLAVDFRGPFPILNCSLNLGGSSDLALHTRHSASFSMTPLRCGSDRPRVGYAPTRSGEQEFGGGIMLGQAVAISGAAASPNMGYNTSPLVAFLLTMFNVRLGWWFPNPGKPRWYLRSLSFSLYYLTKELFGAADETNLFVNVSDGGHFENLGVYELIRRRCKVIIASDAECDDSLEFGSLGNLVRICETDFGAKIDIDVSSIRQQKDGHSLAHCTVGKINYSNGSLGYLIYLKASITGDEDVGVAQYRSQHPSFPHESTADQFFTESQFESYRRLGEHVVHYALRGIPPSSHPVAIAEKLYDVWAPSGLNSEVCLAHTKTLDRIWERFRQSDSLNALMDELLGGEPDIGVHPSHEEVCACLELLQLMENVFLDLRLDDFWEHPDNRGWAMLFMAWARSTIFRRVWRQARRTFGIRFEYFCDERLGLERDDPIARV